MAEVVSTRALTPAESLRAVADNIENFWLELAHKSATQDLGDLAKADANRLRIIADTVDNGEKRDPVVEQVRADLLRRSQLGIKKYGTTLADNPAELKEWLNHAYEEALDLANYLQSAIMKIDGKI